MRGNSQLRPRGHTWSWDFDGNVHEADTLQCVHCGLHWQLRPGSGRKRGFCMNCNGPTCGKTDCDVCVPMLQRIENAEAHRPWLYKPVQASFAGLILPPDMQKE